MLFDSILSQEQAHRRNLRGVTRFTKEKKKCTLSKRVREKGQARESGCTEVFVWAFLHFPGLGRSSFFSNHPNLSWVFLGLCVPSFTVGHLGFCYTCTSKGISSASIAGCQWFFSSQIVRGEVGGGTMSVTLPRPQSDHKAVYLLHQILSLFPSLLLISN